MGVGHRKFNIFRIVSCCNEKACSKTRFLVFVRKKNRMENPGFGFRGNAVFFCRGTSWRFLKIGSVPRFCAW